MEDAGLMSDSEKTGAGLRLETPYGSLLSSLSPVRIRSVLLVSSLYDYFILEEDGRLDDLLLAAFGRSGSGVPSLKQVTGGEAALSELESSRYDLVICLMRLGDMDFSEFGRRARKIRPGVPVVLLAWDTPELQRLIELRDPAAIDRIYVWQGDGRVVPGIIRLEEDSANAIHDASICRVQNLLVVEDSVHFYSRYAFEAVDLVETLMEGILSAEGLSPAQRSLRARARPKVLLATSYEEALATAQSIGDNLLGLVTDQSFPRSGCLDLEAGPRLIRELREKDPNLPVILQSSEPDAAEGAMPGVSILSKGSGTLIRDLRRLLAEGFGFGPLVFTGLGRGRRDRGQCGRPADGCRKDPFRSPLRCGTVRCPPEVAEGSRRTGAGRQGGCPRLSPRRPRRGLPGRSGIFLQGAQDQQPQGVGPTLQPGFLRGLREVQQDRVRIHRR